MDEPGDFEDGMWRSFAAADARELEEDEARVAQSWDDRDWNPLAGEWDRVAPATPFEAFPAVPAPRSWRDETGDDETDADLAWDVAEEAFRVADIASLEALLEPTPARLAAAESAVADFATARRFLAFRHALVVVYGNP